MSRIGQMPIPIPKEVEVTISDSLVTVKGPKGELSLRIHPDMRVERQDGQLLVRRPSDNPLHRSLHGLTRSLLATMVTGVLEGFHKTLEIAGVGYRAQVQGGKLVLQLGFSHPVTVTPPPGIEITNLETFTPTAVNDWLSTRFTVRGIDKQLVGEVAAKIRALRKAEPYKGKGLRYAGEKIRRKAGKAAGKGKAK